MRRQSTASRVMALVGGLVLLGSSAVARPSAIAGATPNASSGTFAHAAAQRAAATRGHVVVQDAARTSKVRPGIHARPAMHLPRTPSTPGPGPKIVTPPLPVEATATAAVAAAVTSFDGVAQNTTNEANVEPPDPFLAVGPDDAVQAVNLMLRITDRNGAAPVDMTLPDFFLLFPNMADTDPRVLYDPLHGRWIAIEASWDCTPGGGATIGHGYLDIAISDTSNPRLGWTSYYRTYNDIFPDYPGIGTSTDKVALSANLFHMVAGSGLDCIGTTYLGADLTVFDWSDLINGASLTYSFFNPNTQLFTIRPAIQAPATSAMVHLIMYQANGGPPPGEDVKYGFLTGSVLAHTIVFYGGPAPANVVVVAPPVSTVAPRQPGSPATIVDAVDERITDAIFQANKLTFVATYGCTPAGDAMVRDCVRVTQLDTSLVTITQIVPTELQDFLVAENGKDSFMGGIGVSPNGALHVVWTRSSATAGDWASTYGAYQLPTDAANSLSVKQLLAAGTANYPGTRWGDYVGVPQDPQDPNAVWQADEYSTGGIWATKVARMVIGSGSTYVPIAPVRVLNTISGTGLSGTFHTGIPRTFAVAGAFGIPPNAKAITGNLAVTGQTGAGFVSVTVNPTSAPATSTINFPLGDVRANNITTPLSPAGMLSAVYKSGTGTTTNLVLDVTGYFLDDNTGATYNPITPVRMLNTLDGTGLIGKLQTGVPRHFQVSGVSGIPANAIAISGNLAVINQTSGGFVSLTPDETSSPSTSNINFPAADIRANGLTVQLSATGSLAEFFKGTPGSSTDLVLDVSGYYVQDLLGLHFFPLLPGRRINTTINSPIGVFHSSVPQTVTMDGHEGVPLGASAVTGNLAVLMQTQGGFVSITPDPTSTPLTSTINFPIGDVRANGVTVPVNGSGDMSFVYRAGAGKTTHLVLDITGYFK